MPRKVFIIIILSNYRNANQISFHFTLVRKAKRNKQLSANTWFGERWAQSQLMWLRTSAAALKVLKSKTKSTIWPSHSFPCHIPQRVPSYSVNTGSTMFIITLMIRPKKWKKKLLNNENGSHKHKGLLFYCKENWNQEICL